MGRSEQYSFDDIGNDTSPFPDGGRRRGKGIFVSQGTIVVYIILSVLLAALIGLIVNFARPCQHVTCSCSAGQSSISLTSSSTASTTSDKRDATTETPDSEFSTPFSPILPEIHDEDVLWAQCINMSWARRQCFMGAYPCDDELPSIIDYNLPETFLPVHYKIDIRPDIYQPTSENFTFIGSVVISLTCVKASDVIVVHFREMIIDDSNISVTTSDGVQVRVNGTSMDEEVEFFKIHLEREITQGENLTVQLSYTGHIDQGGMTGMYYSDYTVGNVTKYMLATQFEATDARKAFPCLDEPALKATFEVTLWRKEPMVALTNMPRASSTDKGDGWIADYFGTTPVVMPTYLLAFAVADYTYIEGVANNSLTAKHLRHWSRPDYIKQGFVDYSLEACMTMFDYFETYFNFTFDLPKEDQISINDFDAGAMENWGLITYRENRMIWDPEHSTQYEKQRMTGTLAHELLHQWLGNVVTCAWWSDLWLQEGMARYHQHLAMRTAQPEWDVDQIFAAQVIYRALLADQTGHSHPIHTIVHTPDEIDMMFSPITYDKAGCVIRMIKELILKDSYRSAMIEYIKDNAYSSTNFIHLLSSWDKQAAKSNIKLESNITMVMMTWILQSGYPMVTIDRLSNNTIRLSQTRFQDNPEREPTDIFPTPFAYMWNIPVTYVTNYRPTDMTMEWLHMEPFREAMLSEPLSENDWLLGNYKQFGFYRVNYDVSNWLALAKQLQSDHLVFDVINRGQLLSDSFYISKAGHLDYVIHLQLMSYMTSETDYLPWHVTVDMSFRYLTKLFRSHKDFSLFRDFASDLIKPHYDRLGWDEQPQDTHHDIYLRDLILTQYCKLGNEDCITKAKGYFRAWRDNPENVTIIRPDIRDAVYCTSIKHGLAEDWQFLFDQYSTFEHFSLEKARRRRALTCSDDRSTLARLFAWAAESDDVIVSHDPVGSSAIMRDISRSPVGQYVAWEYLSKHWDTQPNRFNTLVAAIESSSSDFDMDKYDQFVSDHPAVSETEIFHFEDMRLIIAQNNRWRHRNENAIFEWLREVTNKKA